MVLKFSAVEMTVASFLRYPEHKMHTILHILACAVIENVLKLQRPGI